MDYFSDIQFRVVVHRYFTGVDSSEPFRPPCNSLEMIRSGKIRFFRNGEESLLEGPVLFWMRAGNSYRFTRHMQQKRSCEHLYFDCTGAKSEKMIAFLEERFPAGILPLTDPGKISELFFEMVHYYRLDPEMYLPELSTLVDSLMLEIIRSGRVPLSSRHDDPYEILSLGDEIRKNPFREFDFTRIAGERSITRYHLSRLFRSFHKMAPCEFVHEQRMIRAAELLRLPGMRIKEVMSNCHYDSLSEFSRAFKRYSSFSPREYRKHYFARSPEEK